MGFRDDLQPPPVPNRPLPAAWETAPEPGHDGPDPLGTAPEPTAEGARRPTAGAPPADVARRRPLLFRLRHLRRLGSLVVVALVVIATSGWYLTRGASTPEKFLTATAELGAIEDTVSATGTLQPLQFVDVGTQVTGQLRALHVAIGDAVSKGQLIAEIDASVFQSKVDTTHAALQNLEAQLLDRQAQLQLAEQLRARNLQLKAADAVSEEIVQQGEAAAIQAKAQVAALKAQIQQTLSSLAGDEANLRYTRIYAPMSGTVVALNARQGQTLVSSQQAPVILRIADLRTMTVWAQVSEADVPRIQVGMPVYFNTLGLPERRWTGQVRQVLPTPEAVNNVVLYNVLFDAANADGVLKPQMSAQVFFRIAGEDNALTVPTAALQAPAKAKQAKAKGGPVRKDNTYVVRVLRNGQVEERPVSVGLQTRMQAQILHGLNAGDEVIVGSASAKGKGGQGKGASGASRAL